MSMHVNLIFGGGGGGSRIRRRGFATAAVRCGIHTAKITIAMRHSQGDTMQYVALSLAERAAFTTRLAIAPYEEDAERNTSS